MMTRLRGVLSDQAGLSSYVGFLLVFLLLLSLILGMFEVSSMANVKLSASRGVQEGLIKASMSPYAMGDEARWDDMKETILQQGTVRSQMGDISFVSDERAFSEAEIPPGKAVAYVTASSSAPTGTVIPSGGGIPVVSSGIAEPPTMEIRLKYGYSMTVDAVRLLRKDGMGRIAFSVRIRSINEHPDYLRAVD